MAHLFCELFYRSRASGLARGDTCFLPIGLNQLAEALGLSLATVNRALANLRDNDLADFKSGSLTVRNWDDLADHAEFNPRYLHLRRPPI
jgi:CRP-like cAMP-binding protein